LKDKNLGFSERFALIVKCLLTNIDQINKLEYFALEKRVKEGMEKNKNRELSDLVIDWLIIYIF